MPDVRRLPKRPLFELLGYQPQTPEVWAYHDSKARIRFIDAPARTSKSWATGHDAVIEALPDYENSTGALLPVETRMSWIIGPTYDTNKEFQYVWDMYVEGPARGLARGIESAQNNAGQGTLRIVLDFGRDKQNRQVRSIIEGKSSTNERSLQGEHVDNVVLSEAAEHDERIWTRYLATRYGKATFPTTPKVHAAWILEMIEFAELEESLQSERFQFTPEANPRYDWELFWIEHMKAESRILKSIEYRPEHPSGTWSENHHDCLRSECFARRDAFFAEQFLGQWTLYEDRVLPFFEKMGVNGEVAHVIAEEPDWLDGGRWFWSFDYGQHDPYVGLLWSMGPDGTFILVDEFADQNLSGHDVMERVRDIERRHKVKPEFYVGDPKRPEVERLLRDHGLPLFSSIHGKNMLSDRGAGKRLIVDLLSIDPATNRPMLFVMKRCKSTIQEWKTLRYKESRSNKGFDEDAERAIVGGGHHFDAARYGLMAARTIRKPVVDHRMKELLARISRRRVLNAIPRHKLVGTAPSSTWRS